MNRRISTISYIPQLQTYDFIQSNLLTYKVYYKKIIKELFAVHNNFLSVKLLDLENILHKRIKVPFVIHWSSQTYYFFQSNLMMIDNFLGNGSQSISLTIKGLRLDYCAILCKNFPYPF